MKRTLSNKHLAVASSKESRLSIRYEILTAHPR